jgi:hypothetical protein
MGKNSLYTACPPTLIGCLVASAGTTEGDIWYIADCSLPRCARMNAIASV